MTGEIEPELIAPSERRLDPAVDEDGARMHQLKKIGIRTLDVLAELELAGGTIEAEKHLGSTIAELTESGISGGDYSRAINKTVQAGLTARRGRRLGLTPEGKTAIADLKSNPDLIKEEGEYLRPNSSSVKILRSIENRAIYPDDEGNFWTEPVGNTEPVLRGYAEDFDMSERTLTRRMYDLHSVKRYVAVERVNGEIVNTSLEEEGAAKLAKIREHEGEPGDLPEAINMIEAKTQQGIALAGRLGKRQLVGMLEATTRDWALLDASEEELTDRLGTLKIVLDKLTHEHDFWLGNEEIEPFDEYDYGAHFEKQSV